MPPPELATRDLRRLALAEEIEYLLVRRRGRRGVGLKVDEKGLTVSAPLTMPLARIEAVVRESEAWVLKKVREWSTRQVPRFAWEEGARVPFLGGGLALRFVPGGRLRAERHDAELRVTLPPAADEAAIRRAVVAWYKRQAMDYLQQRVSHLSAAAGIAPPRLMISPAMGRWGSCNSRREVRLAWRLMKAPAELVDYVVCHELAHLRHMNHSAAFWAEVGRQCPAYKELRRQLFAIDYLYRSF